MISFIYWHKFKLDSTSCPATANNDNPHINLLPSKIFLGSDCNLQNLLTLCPENLAVQAPQIPSPQHILKLLQHESVISALSSSSKYSITE